MSFVNTRATLGDQATVDGLVEHSLTELKEDGIGTVEAYACCHNTGLQSLELPSVSWIKANAFEACSNLEVVKLGGEGSSNSLSIGVGAFNACSKLKHLLIDRPTMATLAATSAFTGTLIEKGEGAVYVPESLVATYKANTYWKNYLICKLADYPRSNFDAIEDSWSEIIANSDYTTDYAVGDTKTISVNGTTAKMQLVAKDTDIKSTDHTSKARMTWLCKGILTTHRMNATNTTSGGWGDSEMRSWLRSDILTTLPSEVQNAIVPVDKTYRCKSPNNETLTISDTIWIPSYKEVRFSNATYIESDGVVYSGVFDSGNTSAADNKRIKYNSSGAADYWWLRSDANGNGNFGSVHGQGYFVANGAVCAIGVVFGFCI